MSRNGRKQKNLSKTMVILRVQTHALDKIQSAFDVTLKDNDSFAKWSGFAVDTDYVNFKLKPEIVKQQMRMYVMKTSQQILQTLQVSKHRMLAKLSKVGLCDLRTPDSIRCTLGPNIDLPKDFRPLQYSLKDLKRKLEQFVHNSFDKSHAEKCAIAACGQLNEDDIQESRKLTTKIPCLYGSKQLLREVEDMNPKDLDMIKILVRDRIEEIYMNLDELIFDEKELQDLDRHALCRQFRLRGLTTSTKWSSETLLQVILHYIQNILQIIKTAF